MDLVPCVHCQRHVAITESTCPFCTHSVAPERSRFAFAGRLTRAAIFSAAVVGCDSKGTTKPPPPPPEQHQQGSGTEDLEKMLDDKQVVEHPAIDASIIDGVAVAATADAGAPVDAGKSLADEKREHLRRQIEQHRLRHQRELDERKPLDPVVPDRTQNIPMPYGAPPARRRLV